MKKIILVFIFLFSIIMTARAVETINDHCYQWQGVLVCGELVQSQKEVAQIEPVQSPLMESSGKDEDVIITTYWEDEKEEITEGLASFYTVKSSGLITANGERYNEDAMTCASMGYPFGTILKVTNIENHKFVLVRVTDRGNFKKKYGRIIDLSKGAFAKIADLKLGVITVKIEVVK